MNLEQQIENYFGLSNVIHEHLNTPTNDVLDNVHRHGDSITVFDFDSAGACWRSIEPYGVLSSSKESFEAWLDGYRSVRPFNQHDEEAVAAFSIIGDLRVVAWDLGVARSSRGKPLLGISDLPGAVDTWLDWERKNI